MSQYFPATQFLTNEGHMEAAISNIPKRIRRSLRSYYANDNKLLEAQRPEQRTNYDIEMLREMAIHQNRKLF